MDCQGLRLSFKFSGRLVPTEKKGNLKSVIEKEEEDLRYQSKLESSLISTIEMKSSDIQKMKTKYEDRKRCLDNVMNQKEDILRAYNEGKITDCVDLL